MKDVKKLVSLILTLLILTSSLISCKKPITEEPETTLPVPILPSEGQNVYNIIYALATVPPVLSAIDAIGSGHETYAIIERGKTYSGIDKLENFTNSGFDTGSNESSGLSEEKMNTMTEQVKLLNSSDPNAFFVFYAQDGTALSCAAIAANAGIPSNRFHVYMCEDGTGAYVALKELVTKEGTTPYNAYKDIAAEAAEKFNAVMAKTDNKPSDNALFYDIKLAFGLASLPNFTYWLQDRSAVESCFRSLETDRDVLLANFGLESSSLEPITPDYRINLRFQKISEGIAKLSKEQREDYLVLMYGDYYLDTYNALTRSERAGEEAPDRKLIYIGARHSYYPLFASDEAHGIGGLKEGDSLPSSYAELDDKYKIPLLFPKEEDYLLFLNIVNDASSYAEGTSEEVKSKVKVAAFNLYIDYIYSLKFAFSLYGKEYDLIIKGHPREVLGSSEEWGERYKVTYGEENTYCFDSLLDSLLLSFHESDSTGKYIGTVPYGTAAENLAYLGADVSICGLPSSTYSGYDPDVDVLFVMAMTDESIDGDASQVKDRYLSGNLTFSNGEGEETCRFYNTGNTYKYAALICKDAENQKGVDLFEGLFEEWMSEQRKGADDIDGCGFAKTP